ncbi:MAG TPA: hypothetical protein VM888_07640 [Chitinophagaceae bacterium]|nr:hypothetical protein [Chitinophagaceae bacterium]
MKRITTSSLLVIGFLFATTSIQAQATLKNKNNASNNGYWVIESNVQTPKDATILFYNNQHEVIYKESVTGKKINVARPKVCRQLNAVLQQSLTAWNKEQVVKENKQWVVKSN